MAEFAVTAIGADRPGIVARITGVLYERGGSVTDSTMTILAGHFAMMLLVEIDDDPEAIEAALAAATDDLGLRIRVASVDEGGEGADIGPPTHTLTVYGADRPGIVAQASAALAEHGVNITDLRTRVLAGGQDVYACVMEVAVPADVDAKSLADAVRGAVADTDVSVQPLDGETL